MGGAAVEASPQDRGWSRSYPPLVLLVVSVLIAAFVLPSSLNLPQSNPSTVLEYAPVPPEDDSPSPPQGNLSSLGLGASGTLTAGGKPPPPPPPRDIGLGTNPKQKRCVGDPPRQTEDLAAPPCVNYFDGDNGGATWQGVTGDTITVIVYYDVGCPNFECSPAGENWIDLDDPPKPRCPKTYPTRNPTPCDDLWVRIARAFNRYFNDRFQTYNRRVKYIVHYTDAASSEARKADAADDWSKYKPFAVIDRATFNGYNDAYETAMADRGVLTFTSETALKNEFFRNNDGFSWGFWPDVEHWAAQYGSYVCQKIVPNRSFHAGNPELNNKPRKLGLWYTRDAGEPGIRHFAALVKEQVRRCGGNIAAEETYLRSGFVVDNADPGVDARNAVAKFEDAGVTTILYLGGLEGKLSIELDNNKYYPEIVLAGDLENDNNTSSRVQNRNAWQNAFGTSWEVKLGRPEEVPAYRAYKEADNGGQPDEARLIYEAYRDHFMLFQAIQVAGPRLTKARVDEGFHAIPTKASTHPEIPAMFFDPGDYTMVKDATEVWWDPNGDSPGAPDPGCYRMVRGGKRFLAGKWEGGNDAFNPADQCTGHEGGRPVNPTPN